jgi:hypothetical protein
MDDSLVHEKAALQLEHLGADLTHEPGVNAMILKYFRRKNRRKNGAFWLKLQLVSRKNC